MAQLTARTSTIFIATGDKTQVYRSVEDVPPALRQKLLDCTRGINSATILIADKRGREELVRALQGRPSEVQCRLVENIRARQPEGPADTSIRSYPSRLKSAYHSAFPNLWVLAELLLPWAVVLTLLSLLEHS